MTAPFQKDEIIAHPALPVHAKIELEGIRKQLLNKRKLSLIGNPDDLFEALATTVKGREGSVEKRLAEEAAKYNELVARPLGGVGLADTKQAAVKASEKAIKQYGVDVTDPSVVVENPEDLPADLRIVRGIRYLLSSTGVSLISPLGVGGITEAEAEGRLAEPKTIEEKFAKFIAPMIAGAAQLGAASLLAALAVGAAPAAAVAAGAGAAAGGAGLGALLRRMLGEKAVETLARPVIAGSGRAAALSLAGGLKATKGLPKAVLPASKISQLVPGLAFDAAAGSFAGYVETKAQEAKAEGEDLSDVGGIIWSGILGLGLGSIFRGRTIWNTARAAYRLNQLPSRVLEELNIVPGRVVNGKRIVLKEGQVFGEVLEGPNKGKLVPLAIEDFEIEIKKEIARIAKTQQELVKKQGVAPEEQLELFEGMHKDEAQLELFEEAPKEEPPPAPPQAAAAPEGPPPTEPSAPQAEAAPPPPPPKPPTPPKEVAPPPGQPPSGTQIDPQSASFIAARYATMPSYIKRVRELAELEALEPYVQQLVGIVVDPESSTGMRTTAAGMLRAIDAILDRQSSIELQGFDRDLLAVKVISLLEERGLSREGIKKALAAIAVEQPKSTEIVNRAIELVDMVSSLETKDASAIERLAVSASESLSRGFKAGNKAIDVNTGVVVKLLKNPVYGRTLVKDPLKNQVYVAHVENLIPSPKPNTAVKLRDGTEAIVLQVRDDTGSVLVITKDQEGSLVPRWIGYKDVAELGGRVKASDIKAYREARKERIEKETFVKLPTSMEAVTVTGEKVRVLAIGENFARVKSASGRSKVIDLADLVREDDPIPIFLPKTVPPPGYRLWYIEVPEALAAKFEESAAQGAVQNLFKGTAHILPQPYKEGVRLYAVLVPENAESTYGPNARRVLAILSGKPYNLESYDTPVSLNPKDIVKVFRVPPALQLAAIRPQGQVAALSGENLRTYISHLLVLNEPGFAETEAAKYFEAIAKSKSKLSKALKASDGENILEAEKELSSSSVEAAKEQIKAEQPLPQQVEVQIRATASSFDPNTVPKLRLIEQGYVTDNKAVIVDALNSLEARGVEDFPDRLFWLSESGNTVGQVVKRTVPALDESGAPSTREVFELSIYEAIPHVRDLTRVGSAKLLEKHTFDSPEDVIEAALRKGLKPSLTRVPGGAEWYHPDNRNLRIYISKQPKGKVVVQTRAALERVLSGGPKIVSPDEFVEIVFAKRTSAIGSQEFARTTMPLKQLEEFLDKAGFIPSHAEGLSPVDAFKALPSIDSLRQMRGAELYRAMERIEQVLEEFILHDPHGIIPDAVANYAAEAGKIWFALGGTPPFTREMRFKIGIPTTQDLYAASVSRDPSSALFFDKLFSEGHHTVLDAVTVAGEVNKHIFETKEWVNVLARLKAISTSERIEPPIAGTDTIVMGRLVHTGQPVQIVDVNLADGTVIVRYPGTARESEVSAYLVRPAEDAQTLADYRVSELVNSGRYQEHFGTAVPPMGAGLVERSLGLTGVTRETVLYDKMLDRTKSILSRMNLKEDDITTYSPNTIQELIEIYLRGIELDSQREGEFFSKILPKALDEVVNPNLSANTRAEIINNFNTAFKRLTYEYLKNAFGRTPLAELIARADSGWLTTVEVNQLREMAKKAGIRIPAKISQSKLVRKLIDKGVLDPNVAEISVSTAQTGALMLFADEVEKAAGGIAPIEIRWRRFGKDLLLPWLSGIPERTVEKHPFAALIFRMVREAQNSEIRHNQRIRNLEVVLKRLGYNEEKFDKVAEHILNTPEGVSAVETAPEELKEGVQVVQEFLEENKKLAISHFLRIGAVVRFDPSNADHVAWAAEQGIRDIQGLTYVAPNIAEAARSRKRFNIKQGIRSAFTDDEIELFWHLYDSYPNAASLPKDTPKKIVDVFDYFKQWGRTNYFPYAHEGRWAIVQILPDGTERLRGWTKTGVEAHFVIAQLMKDEGIPKTSFRVENRAFSKDGWAGDDILIQYLPSPGQGFRDALRFFSEQGSMSPEDLAAVVLPGETSLKLGITPLNVHLRARKANLKPINMTNWQSLKLYNARIGRAEFDWRMLRIFELLEDRDLDAAVSRAVGAPLLSEMPQLRSYVERILQLRTGYRTSFEVLQDHIVNLLQWMTYLPKGVLNKWFNGEPVLTLSDFHRNYASRAVASKLTRFQASLHLGFNPASGMINLSQYFLYTGPKLIGDGLDAKGAAELLIPAWRKGISLVRSLGKKQEHELTAEEKLWKEFLDAVGVDLQASKLLTGTGLSLGDFATGRPTGFGQTKGEYLLDLATYYSMVLFNGAERVNRYSTAVASAWKFLKVNGYKSIEDVPKERWHEMVLRAQKLVQETQFIYDDLSLPLVMQELGPFAKVVFQFKPFIFNALSYNKNLVQRAVRGDKDALKQLSAHLAMTFLAGGVVGLTYNPVFQTVGSILDLVKLADVLDVPSRLAFRRRQERLSPAEQLLQEYGHPFRDLWQTADNLVFYGIPGLFNMNLGQRLGVMGQELGFPFRQNILGPAGNMYHDTLVFIKKVIDAKTDTSSAAKLAAAAAGGLLGSYVGSGATGFPKGLLGSLTALGLVGVFDKGLDLSDALSNTDEGESAAKQAHACPVRPDEDFH